MNRHRKKQAIITAKVAEIDEISETTMWILGSLPLLAIASISYLILHKFY